MIRALLRRFRRKASRIDDVDGELAFHLEMQTRRYVAEGMTPEAARVRARARLGDVDRARLVCREIGGAMEETTRRAEWRQGIRQDLTYAFRSLRKTPLFTATALLTVALGIGANTAVFSVVNAVLLRSVGYPDADRLVMIWNSYGQAGLSEAAVAAAEFADIKDQQRSFEHVAAIRPQASTLTTECGSGAVGCEPERVMAYAVSPEFFDLLQVKPIRGRGFTATDGAADANRVILITDALWRRRFGADPNTLGRTVSVNALARTIVGVMPPGVRFPDAPVGFLKQPADLWIPYDWARARTDNRGNQYLAVIARINRGAGPDGAQSNLDAIADGFRRDYADRYVRAGLVWRIKGVSLLDTMIGDVRPRLYLLSGSVALVLLIACANVANLVLARGTSRSREVAVRSALGATRGRIVRQLFIETAVVVCAGGVLGVGLALAGIRGLLALDPGDIPYLDRAGVDLTVLSFSALATAVTGVLIGLGPALRQSIADPQLALADATRTGGAGAAKRGVRRALAVAEVALAMVVLVGAGLLVRSFMRMQQVPSGIDPGRTVVAEIALPRARYDTSAKIFAFHRGLIERLEALPNVTRASAVYPLPMSGNGWGGTVIVRGRSESLPEPHAELAVALPGYFQTLRIPIVEGRDFATTDAAGGSPVAIVDETFARKYWPGESAIGQRISPFDPPKDDSSWTTVIGVVGHVRNSGARAEGEGQLYLSELQRADTLLSFIVDSTGPATPLLTGVRAAVRDLDRDQPVAKLGTTADIIGRFVARERFNTSVLGVFGAVALGLATIGLYGVLAFLVTMRTREIGIRIALGGRPGRIRTRIVMEGLLLASAGIAAGLAAALALSTYLKDMLYEITPTDPLTYAAIAALLLVVSLVASYVPARRATAIDPVKALQ